MSRAITPPPKRTHPLEPDSTHTSPIHKKQCSAPTTTPTSTELLETIRKLPPEAKDALLHQAAIDNPSLLIPQIHEAAALALAAELALPPLDFDKEICDVEVMLGEFSDPYFDVEGGIAKARDSIVDQAGPETRYEVKRNAIAALLQIYVFVVEEDDEEGSWSVPVAEAMEEVAEGFSGEERERFKSEEGYRQLVKTWSEGRRAGEVLDVLKVFGEVVQG